MKNILTIGLMLLFFGCTKKSVDPIISPETPEVPDVRGNISYLALGDSYTIGQSVVPGEKFPNQLAARLTENGDTVKSVKFVARTGWTTTDLLNGIATTSDFDSTYSFVTLLIGVNNEFRGQTTETFEEEFPILLDKAIEFAGGKKEHVFVLSIPDYAFTPAYSGRSQTTDRINAFNEIKQRKTEEKGVAFFNITPISREGLNDPDLISEDNLHPSGKQYRLWVNNLYPSVRQIFL